MDEKLLDIQDLSVWYKTYRGFAEVVDHINLYVGKGEKIGLVGESGCGKTTTMKMVMRTLDERGIKVGEGSKLLFGGEDILAMDAKALLDSTAPQDLHDLPVAHGGIEPCIHDRPADDGCAEILRAV